MNQQLIDFYKGTGTDSEGRSLKDIMSFGDEQLEATHDFIQWLFPLKEPSPFNKNAPLLDDETIKAFRDDLQLKIKVAQSLGKFLRFLQLDAEAKTQTIITTVDVIEMHWLTRKNHNMRRLTRILTSLRYLGLDEFSDALYSCLCDLMSKTNIIDDETKEYWQKAAEGPLP